jgi:hypothetical protein
LAQQVDEEVEAGHGGEAWEIEGFLHLAGMGEAGVECFTRKVLLSARGSCF